LSVVRSRTPDPSLVAELSRLVLTARATLTGPARFEWRRVPRFFTHDMPLAFYKARWWWVTIGLTFYTIGGVILWWVAGDPQVAHRFGITDEEIDNIVNGAFEGYYSEFMPQNFGLQVWTNNSFLAAMCLASGVLVVPPLLMIWNEAVRFGLIGGIMVGAGHGEDFFGLIAPHGLLELTAVFVAAGVGMRMGWAWIEPGPVLTRAQSLAVAAKQAMAGALGLVVVLFVSAMLEAFVTPSPLPLFMRDAIGLGTLVLFLAYVWFVGGSAARAGQPPSEPDTHP
jgi:uncharacterized membrane protein SpoIIM required for sporulation